MDKNTVTVRWREGGETLSVTWQTFREYCPECGSRNTWADDRAGGKPEHILCIDCGLMQASGGARWVVNLDGPDEGYDARSLRQLREGILP